MAVRWERDGMGEAAQHMSGHPKCKWELTCEHRQTSTRELASMELDRSLKKESFSQRHAKVDVVIPWNSVHVPNGTQQAASDQHVGLQVACSSQV